MLALIGSAVAQTAAAAPAVATPAIDWMAAVKSLWDAVSPAISLPLLLAYGVTWLAAFVKQATPDSNPAWKIVRYLIDLVAANVANAKNAPK